MTWPLFTKMFIAEARDFLSNYELNVEQQYLNNVKLDKVKYQSIGEKVIIFSQNTNIPVSLVINNVDELEQLLKDYIHTSLGFRFDYSNYFDAVRASMKNILKNASISDFKDINNFVEQYTKKISNLSSEYPLSSTLIEVIKRVYSPRDGIICMNNKGKYYSFDIIQRKDENFVPTATIRDIDVLEKTIKSTLETIINSDSLFNKYFEVFDKDEAIINTLDSIMRNVSTMDLFDLNIYFLKYKGFFEDTSLDEFKNKIKIGTLFGEDLYLLRRKANSDYETPYFLSFTIQGKNEFIELPNIRVGINEKNGKKTAHILAVQASQDNEFIEKYKHIENETKKLIKNKGKIRYFNPMFIVSLALTFGLLKKLNITEVEYATYLPLRWQRKEKDLGISEDHLINLQHQLTEKNINNFLKMNEYFEDIKIKFWGDQPEINLLLDISEIDVEKCDNQFLSELFEMGYNCLSSKTKQKKK